MRVCVKAGCWAENKTAGEHHQRERGRLFRLEEGESLWETAKWHSWQREETLRVSTCQSKPEATVSRYCQQYFCVVVCKLLES